jgi:anti-anti-sigma regulatory factor
MQLDGRIRAGMRLVWAAYGSHHAQLNEELRQQLLEHPEFGPLVRATPRDPEQEARSFELVRGAMERDEWEPYFENIQAQAVGYANAEVTFGSWFELINVLRLRVLDLLLEAHTGDGRSLRDAIAALDVWLDTVMGVFGQAFVSASQQVISRQQRAIRQLSTPVLQLRPGLLLLPIVGALDRERLDQLRTELLAGVRERRARAVVIDVTGVPEVDSMVANQLIEAVSAARMMGAAVVVSGLSAEIAQTLVTVGLDLAQVDSAGDLQSGIERADRIARGAWSETLHRRSPAE